MGLAKRKERISVEDYLAGENDGETRHEYLYGEVYAMAGASDRHNQICGNIFVKVFTKVGDSKCRAFMNDMKLQADDATFYYPDIFVACDNPDRYFRRAPILIVEVLSASTERADKHEKLRVYQQIETLREYVIVAQDKMRVEIHRRLADGDWSKEVFNESNEAFDLQSVELTFNVAEIYRGVDFEDGL